METSKIYNKHHYEAKNGFLKPLPVKVLQFGTGVLLRGLPDYFINKANKKGIFNGTIVVVKSTTTGGVGEFEQQDNLYHHVIKGLVAGKEINELHENTSISRVLVASTQWQDILALAKSPELKIVISNTTEAGLVFDPNDTDAQSVPSSFPGKLLAVLWHRWNHFKIRANDFGLIILPTELVPDNGTFLKKIIIDLATLQQLPNEFITWIIVSNDFCNTLVDRIVTGNLPEKEQLQLEAQLGYQDHLLITSEPFALWAIETSHKRTVNELCFAQVDPGVIVAPSIEKFRELKLRLLNGTHTFSCGVAILAGFETVKEAMLDADFRNYINELIRFEIGPTLINNEITNDEVNAFADVVLDRFSNPNIAHFWKSIAMNYTEKMKMRNTPIIEKYISSDKKVPELICFSFAVYCIYQESLFQVKVDLNEFSLNEKFQAEVTYWIQLIQQSDVKKIMHQLVKNKVAKS